MNKLKNIILLILSLLLQTFLFGQVSHSVRFSQNDAQFSSITGEDGVEYQRISFSETHSLQELGNPELPEKYIKLIVPSNQDVESITIKNLSQVSVNGNYLIYPVQHPVPLDKEELPPFIEPNPEVYNSDNLYPSDCKAFIRDGYFDGANHIIIVAVYPYQYKPKSLKLFFNSSLEFTVNFKTGISRTILVNSRSEKNQLMYDQILLNSVDNPEMISQFQVKPTRIQSNPIETLGFYEYVLITSNALKNSFNNFIEWKKRKGIDIGVVTTEEIYANYTGDLTSGIYDDAGKVRQYLSDAYQEGTIYALLGGDHLVVPVRYGAGDNNRWTRWRTDDYKIPADLYYSDFNGDWDVDGQDPDGITRYGELQDDVEDNPEIFVGRLPCSSIQDINYWTEKLIAYEQNPGNGNLSYLTNTFWIWGDDIWVHPNTIKPHCPATLSHNVWDNYNSYSADQVVAEMSDHYGLLNWHCHGDVVVFRINSQPQQVITKDNYIWGDTGPNNGLDNMTNNKFYSTVYSICCDIAAFDDYWFGSSVRSMAEGFTCFFDDRGGPELLGNTRYGWQFESPDLQMDFYDLLTLGTQDPESGESYFHLGVSEGVSKQGFYDHYTKLTHNLFGCPETQIWVNTPTQFTSAAVTDGGSYLTVNAGVAGSEINVRSLDNGVSYNLTAHNVTSYSFNTSVRPLIVTITKSQYLPYSAVTGGTLTTNGTLLGKLKVLNTITVASSKTLTIEPNTILNFTSNSSLVINGVLNAIGTSTDRITLKSNSGTTHSCWGTLTFSGSGAAGSQLKYADIKYGTKIEAINTSNITIQYCNIDTTYDGVRFNNTTGSILNNTITTNSLGHGVVAENAANVTIKENIITKTNTNRCGVGIYFGGGANGIAALNDIYRWDWGICAIWSSSPTSYSSANTGKNNRIRNCNSGFTVYRLSYPVFGTGAQSNYSWNSLSGNSYNAKVGMTYSDYESYLLAGNSWWGSNPPNTALFQVGSSSLLYYNPYLTSDPWEIPSSPVSNSGSDNLKKENVSESLLDDFEIINGIRLLVQNKIREAKDHFLSYISKNPTRRIGYILLYYCYNDETAPELINYFKSLPGSLSKDFKLLLSQLYLKHNSSNLAKENNNLIIAENPNSSLETRAKLNNVYIALYNENNINEAINIFNDVMNKPELSTPLELQLVYDAITSYATTYGQETKNLPLLSLNEQTNEPELFKEGVLTQTADIPTEYSLSSNFPNPFNPTTTIKFDLPNDGLVQMKVFDILGNEVVTLVNEQKVAGKYEVNFNANTLASGVYIYKLQAGNFISAKKMLLLK